MRMHRQVKRCTVKTANVVRANCFNYQTDDSCDRKDARLNMSEEITPQSIDLRVG